MRATQEGSPLLFFGLVFALSLPFWIVSAGVRFELLPGLPLAGLMFVCPALAGIALRFREGGVSGASDLLARAFDFTRTRSYFWFAAVLLINPALFALAYVVQRWLGQDLPAPEFGFFQALALSGIFFATAVAEELGWSGYAIEPMQRRWGALSAGVLLGAVWAAWHVVALLQVGRSVEWIAWWSLWTVAARVVMVWFFNRTGRSVFAVALYHGCSNLCWQLFPVHGSHFDPRVAGILTGTLALLIGLSTLVAARPPAR